MYFYEIHDGDEEVGTAVLLGHAERLDPDDFFARVKRARGLISGAYEEDSLAEAVANELERSGGFLHVTDDRLVASVAVDEDAGRTYLVTGDDQETRSVIVSSDDPDDMDDMDDADETDRRS